MTMKRWMAHGLMLLCLLTPVFAAESPPHALVAGRAAVADELWPIAEKELRGLLEGDLTALKPDELQEAVVLMARVFLMQKREADLLNFLAKRRRHFATAAPGADVFLRALTNYELDRFKDALDLLDRFDDKYSGSPWADKALQLRGWCLVEVGDRAGAIRQFQTHARLYATGKASTANQLDLGRVLLADGQYDAASAAFSVVIADDFGRLGAEARMLLARTRMEQQRWTEAAQLLDALLADATLHPADRSEALFCMAGVQEHLTNRTAVVAALTEVIGGTGRPETVREARRQLGAYLLQNGQGDEAIQQLRQFISEKPEEDASALSQLSVAEYLLNQAQHGRALEEYQNYLESYTNDVGRALAFRGRGWALMGLERYAEAAEAFKRAAELFVDDPTRIEECLVKAADAQFMHGQYGLAAEGYGRVLQQFAGTPRTPELRLQLSACLDGAGRPDEARHLLTGLVASEGDGYWGKEARLRLALRDYRDGRLAEAAAGYSRLIGPGGTDVHRMRALLGRGVVHFDRRQYAEALADFSAVAAVEREGPTAAEALFRIALTRYGMGESDAAVQQFGRFLERFPKSVLAPDAIYWLARHAYNSKAYAEAEERFLAFQRQYPGHPKGEDALLWATRSAVRQRDYVRAVEKHLSLLFTTYPEGRRQAEARFEQGNILVDLARFGDAILAFQAIPTSFPQHELVADAWLRIGDCHFVLGGEDASRYEQALIAFRKAAAAEQAAVELVLHAEYKAGRCLDRMGRRDEAVAQYYTQVMIRYLEIRERGEPLMESAKMWFLRAARDAADILESGQEWRKAVSVLSRVIGSGVENEAVIEERIRKIQADHWWLFY